MITQYIASMMKDTRSRLLFILGFLAFWANGDNYAAAPLLVSIAADMGLAISQASLTVAAYMLSFGLFTILFGPLSDKFGKGRIIITAAFGTAVFSILGGLSTNFPMLVIFRSFNGAFGAGIFPVTMALIGTMYNDEERHGAIAKVMGFMFLGGASATLIGGALAQFSTWRAVYILYGAAELLLALAVVRLIPIEAVSKESFSLTRSYRAAFKRPELLMHVATIFFVGFAVFGSFSYAGHYVQTITGFPILLVGMIITAFGLGTVAAGRLLPGLRPRLGSAFLPVLGTLGAASLLLVMSIGLLLPGPVTASLLLSTGFFGFGIAFVALQSTLIMGVQKQLPAMRGTAMSMASFGMFVGGGIGTQINGRIVTAGADPFIYALGAGLLFTAALVTGLRMQRMVRLQKKQAAEAA
ncbi:multidrug effflux MFS transporter [Spirochaeta dissipatitropha]